MTDEQILELRALRRLLGVDVSLVACCHGICRWRVIVTGDLSIEQASAVVVAAGGTVVVGSSQSYARCATHSKQPDVPTIAEVSAVVEETSVATLIGATS